MKRISANCKINKSGFRQNYRKREMKLSLFFHFVGTCLEDGSKFGGCAFEDGEKSGEGLAVGAHFGEVIDASEIEDFATDEAARNFEVRIIFGKIDSNASRGDRIVGFHCDGDGAMEFCTNGFEDGTGEGFFRECIFDDAESDAFSTEFRANLIDRIHGDAGSIGDHDGIDAIEQRFIGRYRGFFFVSVHNSSN